MTQRKPDKRLVIIIRDSTGALIRMHGTTEAMEHIAVDRFKRDHGGVMPEGYTVEEKEGVSPKFVKRQPQKKGKRR